VTAGPPFARSALRCAPRYLPPLLTADEVAAETGRALSTFWRDVKRGMLPVPYYVTARAPVGTARSGGGGAAGAEERLMRAALVVIAIGSRLMRRFDRCEGAGVRRARLANSDRRAPFPSISVACTFLTSRDSGHVGR
jgi:hypothetical protein